MTIKERPILFSGPMVRAILDGSKTQTRRPIKPQPAGGWEFEDPPCLGQITSKHPKKDRFGAFIKRNEPFPCYDIIPSRFGKTGDQLWVRETWAYSVHALAAKTDSEGPFVYAADGTTQGRLCDRWRPSIHMPRRASRIALEITAVRVQRLLDVTEADSQAEGVSADKYHGLDRPYSRAFSDLWEAINGHGSWSANPWVWVIEFNRI